MALPGVWPVRIVELACAAVIACLRAGLVAFDFHGEIRAWGIRLLLSLQVESPLFPPESVVAPFKSRALVELLWRRIDALVADGDDDGVYRRFVRDDQMRSRVR